MALSAAQLHNAALTLENNGAFYTGYRARANTSNKAGDRREYIHSALNRLHLAYGDRACRDQLRRYLDDTWSLPQVRADSYDPALNAPTIEFWLDSVKYPDKPVSRQADDLPKHVPGCPIPVPSPEYEAAWIAAGRPVTFSFFPTPKETTMSQAIVITTKTLVNGADVANLAGSAVYDLIAQQELEIAKLAGIKNKPNRLVAEIAQRQAGIAALVAHLNSKDAPEVATALAAQAKPTRAPRTKAPADLPAVPTV